MFLDFLTPLNFLKFLHALQVLELDVMDVRIVEERSYAAMEMSTGSHDSYTTHTQRKHFLYFTDEKIFSVLMEICRTLGIIAL